MVQYFSTVINDYRIILVALYSTYFVYVINKYQVGMHLYCIIKFQEDLICKLSKKCVLKIFKSNLSCIQHYHYTEIVSKLRGKYISNWRTDLFIYHSFIPVYISGIVERIRYKTGVKLFAKDGYSRFIERCAVELLRLHSS